MIIAKRGLEMWAKVESIRGKVVNFWITWPSTEEEVSGSCSGKGKMSG